MTERDIFIAAVQKDGAAERDAYLREACAADIALRERVNSLLRAYENAGSFLESPALSPAVSGGGSALAEGPGTVIGPYKLLEQIGEGGMGVVYMAEQIEPVRRKVALKLIKPGMDTKQVIARFEAERQALAMMDHPNIARILDAGSTESGRPYFVMELVRGIPITEYCDQNRLSIDDRLDLFATVCQADHHAHQKGIIHRDLKPSNVLITLHDGTPVPKVIDFGIAKATGQLSLTDKTLYTGFAELIGTPMYLSPEQAELSGIDIDARSDVYSLGVLLYELLTGTTPFDKNTFRTAALDEVRRIIREEEPPPPSTRLGKDAPTTLSRFNASSFILHPSSFMELDWITMKALEKDRRRRYDTAGAFAADIARYRSNHPVDAGPPSAWYRGRKFARRNRRALMMTAVVAMSVTAIVATWTWTTGRLDRARRAVEQSRREVRRRGIEAAHHRYAADIRRAHQLARSGEGTKALELLRKYRPAPGEEDVREFAWYYLMRLCHGERRSLRGHQGAVYHAGFSPDGRTLVSCGQDGTVRLWDVATGRSRRMLRAPGRAEEVNWAEFSADGHTIVTAGDDGQVRLWDVATGDLRATIPAHAGEAYARFTPDGRRLVSVGRKDSLIKLWDMATCEQLKSIKDGDQVIENTAFSPDGRILATAGTDRHPRLWDLSDQSARKLLPVQGGTVFGLAFSADGTRIASGDDSGCVRVWDVSTGELQHGFQGRQHTADIQSVAFLSGDRTIVSAGGYAILKLWDAATGKCIGSLLGHTDKIWGVSVSPDGTTIASASTDGTVKLWEPRPVRLDRTVALLPLRAGRTHLAFTYSSDGKALIVAWGVGGRAFFPTDGTSSYLVDMDLEVRSFDSNTGTQRFHHPLEKGKQTYGPALSPGGEYVAFVSPDRTATTWEVSTGKRRATIGGSTNLLWAGDDLLIVKRPSVALQLVDTVTGQAVGVLEGTDTYGSHALTSTPQGTVLAVGDGDQLGIWDLATRRVARIRRLDRPITIAALSPDATILAVGDGGAAIQLWEVATLQPLGTLPGHSDAIYGLSFSPDGKTLVSNSESGTVKLWDVAAVEELFTLPEPTRGTVTQLRFAPDGRTLAAVVEAEDEVRLDLLQTALPEGLDSDELP